MLIITYTFVNSNQYGFERNISAPPALKIFEIASQREKSSDVRDIVVFQAYRITVYKSIFRYM